MKHRKTLGLVALVAVAGGALAVQVAGADSEPSSLVAITPCRLLDTRAQGIGDHPGPFTSAETATLFVTGEHGDCIIPEGTTAITATATVLSGTSQSWLTIFPADEPKPLASTVNWVVGQPPTSNTFNVGLSADGAIKVFNAGGTVDVIIDINGRYEAAPGAIGRYA